MKTQQQIFDAGLAHIRAQGVPSFDAQRETCVYRLHMGDGRVLKCIVGGMMPDEVYQPYFDVDGGVTAGGLPMQVYKAMEIEKDDPTLSLITVMQTAHDRPAVERRPEDFMERFESWMRQIAAEFNLVYTPPTKE